MPRVKVFDEAAVLDKALDIFWHHGYNGTSMEQLVNGLGISRSSMYDTYGDKYQLFIAALERYRTKTAGEMIDMINQSKHPKITIQQLFNLLVQASAQDKLQRGCFIVNTTIESAAHDKAVAKIISENMQDIENAFFMAVKKGQETGEIARKHTPRAIARFLFNTINGLRVSAKLGIDKKVYTDIVSTALSVLDE